MLTSRPGQTLCATGILDDGWWKMPWLHQPRWLDRNTRLHHIKLQSLRTICWALLDFCLYELPKEHILRTIPLCNCAGKGELKPDHI